MTAKIYSISSDLLSPKLAEEAFVTDLVLAADYAELQRQLTAQEATVTNLTAQVQGLAVENAYLLPKAASELSNAWVLNKYWVGIHAALMHFGVGREHDAIEWLQNTVAGPGIEVPQLSEFAEIETWAVEQQKDSISSARALEVIKAETPATDAALAEIRAQGAELCVKALVTSDDDTFADAPNICANVAFQLRKEQGK
ncbi:hypothetical protein [Cedecea neteri]|uniref:hypothetical protein n=1 Tax=Cedecea neteri TaxID=158822 RepID=UPI0028A0CF40|nr:hypothetical protein [Cedecea neteri]